VASTHGTGTSNDIVYRRAVAISTISRAAVATGNGAFEIVDVVVGPPGPFEVQVAIRASGVCHTDWDSLEGSARRILGHEGAGVVTAVGENTTRVAVGQSVVLNWAIPCGLCKMCRSGHRNICTVSSPVTGATNGSHAHAGATTLEGEPISRYFSLGTMSEMTVVREEAVVAIPQNVPFASAALLGCGVMTGYGSAVHAASVTQGETVAVLGCGGVGLNVIQGCRIAGASRIVAIDIAPHRLDTARTFGATDTIVAQPHDTELQQVRSELGILVGGLADVAFECTSNPALAPAPLLLIRNGGRAVQVSGVEQRVEFDCELFEWDKTYINPLYGQCDPDRDFPKMISLYESGELMLDELVSATWQLDDLDKAFAAMLAGHGSKNVVVFEPGQ